MSNGDPFRLVEVVVGQDCDKYLGLSCDVVYLEQVAREFIITLGYADSEQIGADPTGNEKLLARLRRG